MSEVVKQKAKIFDNMGGFMLAAPLVRLIGTYIDHKPIDVDLYLGAVIGFFIYFACQVFALNLLKTVDEKPKSSTLIHADGSLPVSVIEKAEAVTEKVESNG